MKSPFLDCNDQLAPVWERVVRAGDPPIDVNRKPYALAELPRVLKGYDICIDDHSYLPTDLVDQCGALKHIVFLGTGAGELHESRRARGARHQGPHHQELRRYRGRRTYDCADCSPPAATSPRMDREVRAGTWVPHDGVQLLGKTLGVIGLGGIGGEVLRIGRGLGMEVIAWNRSPRPGAPLVRARRIVGALRRDLDESDAQRRDPRLSRRRRSSRA